ncbi:hypothetical protein EHM94_05770 [Marinobacter sp. NP-6]|uniref:hypothetical protein n=1 Tax=Marinobacter sp. NP-6 TaxID=2488666 RepID=UPI000FCB65F2|nr:hypothetical protein [Marinobacter sp. NP-6]RUT74701.1 hypothetical protein EHM94_05770 [Marinobacter sp. NP-6]
MAGGDVKLRLEAGQDMPVTTPGDYIYLKFADRDIRVTITEGKGVQKPVVMRVGDKYRPGPFKAFNIQNTDPANPAQIIMVVGEGDFNRQVIQGEVTVTPGIRTADGTFIDDRRFDISAYIVPKRDATVELSDGDTLGTLAKPAGASRWESITVDEDGFIHAVLTGQNSFYDNLYKVTFDRELNYVDQKVMPPLFGGSDSMTKVIYYKGDYYKSFGDHISKNDLQWLFPPIDVSTIHLANDLVYAIPANPTANRALVVIDFNGNIVDEIPQSKLGAQTITGLIWEPFGRTWTTKTNTADDFSVYDADFNLLYERDNQPGLGGSFSGSGQGVAVGDVYYSYPNNSGAFYKVQLVDRVKALSGEAFPADCFNPLVRRDWSSRETSANITVQQSAGRATIRGEVIRAAIEMYYGAELEPGFDYMDHVYGITVFNPAGPGITEQARSSGSTLKAAKITDNFAAVLPSKIQLTVDDGLKFRNPLEY